MPAYVEALLERSAEGLDNLQHAFQQSEDGRLSTNEALIALSERLATLSDQMRTDRGGLDEASRDHLRNVDVLLAQLVEDTARGRQQLVSELRAEIKVLARTMAKIQHRNQPDG